MEKLVKEIKRSSEEIKEDKSKSIEKIDIWINKSNTNRDTKSATASDRLNSRGCLSDMLYKCGGCRQSIQKISKQKKI